MNQKRPRSGLHTLLAGLILLPLLATVLSAEESPDASADTPQAAADSAATEERISKAMRWTFFPGLGELALGNYDTAAYQAGFFSVSFAFWQGSSQSPDVLTREQSNVKFDPARFLIARELDARGQLFQDPSFSGECGYCRDLRLYRSTQAFEVSPFLKYGTEFSQTNEATMRRRIAGQWVGDSFFYASYATYRDAGALGSRAEQKGLDDLLLAPFLPRYFLSWKVMLPALIQAIGAAKSRMHTTIVPPGFKRHYQAYDLGIDIAASVGEEAYFRGVIDPSLTHRFGNPAGLAGSAFAFGLLHVAFGEGNPLGAVAFGAYASWLYRDSHGDLRADVASHFWFNVAYYIFLWKHIREDRIANRTVTDYNAMPIVYTIRF